MMAGRTRLLISHSIAAAACADQVLKVGGGVVAIEEVTDATARAYARQQPACVDASGRPALPHVRVREAAQSLAAVGIGAPADGVTAVGVPVDQAHAMGALSSTASEPEPQKEGAKVGAGSSAMPSARGPPTHFMRHAVADLRRRLRGMALLARGVTDGMDGRCAAVAFCALLFAETISVELGVYLLAAYAEQSTARAEAADPPS